MHDRSIAWLALAAALAAGVALADEPPKRPLRLIGEAPAAKDPAPQRFIIDAVITPGDDYQATIEGWFAGLGESAHGSSVEGSCVEERCTLKVDVEGGVLSLVGDFGHVTEAAQARLSLKDYEDKVIPQGAATLRRFSGPVEGLSALAPPDAVDGAELDDLLMWNGQSAGFGAHDKGDPPSTFQRSTLADWQSAHARPATGLIFVSDLAELRTGAADARKTAGWTALGDAAHGWIAGYPAALFPKASQAGAERRFTSADGAASLIIAIEPALSREDFDALVDRTTDDHPERSSVNYTRVNSDMEISYQEAGKAVVEAYHNRPGGLARLRYVYPLTQEDPYIIYGSILQHSLVVSDELKP